MVNDRPRGILTDADRDYLRMVGEERQEEYSRPAQHKRQTEIAKRTHHALWDLPILYRQVGEEGRRKAFGPAVKQMAPWAPTNLLQESFAFLLLGVLEQTNRELDDEEFYETVFSGAIQLVLSKVSQGGAGSIDVDVTVEDWAPSKELHEHEPLSNLRGDTLEGLLQAGEISREEFSKAILERSDDVE